MSTIQAELHGAKPQVFLCRKAIRRVLPASLREHPRRIGAEEIECLPLRGRWGRGLLEAFGFADQDVVQNNGAEIGKQGKEAVQVRRAIPRFRHDSDARHARFRGSGATGGPDSPDSARRTSDRTAPRQPARKSPRAALFNGLIFVSCYALNWERRLGSKRWIKRNFRIGCRLRTGRPRRSGRRRPVRFRPTRTRRDRSLRWSGASARVAHLPALRAVTRAGAHRSESFRRYAHPGAVPHPDGRQPAKPLQGIPVPLPRHLDEISRKPPPRCQLARLDRNASPSTCLGAAVNSTCVRFEKWAGHIDTR